MILVKHEQSCRTVSAHCVFMESMNDAHTKRSATKLLQTNVSARISFIIIDVIIISKKAFNEIILKGFLPREPKIGIVTAGTCLPSPPRLPPAVRASEPKGQLTAHCPRQVSGAPRGV